MTYNRPDQPEINEVIGQRYQILRQLREEPWGGVWLAQDNLLRTEVSLKVLARDDPDWSGARDVFEHAAILGLTLLHPRILGVFHLDKSDRFLYLVEEPFAGESLLTHLGRQERFSLPRALNLLEDLGQALAFAHQQGVVHQCLSPLNILLKGEEPRLANFAFPPAYADEPLHLELRAYAPPEVLHGDRLTPAGNVFSLGVLGFRLAAGSLPYPLTFDEPFPYRLEFPPADLEEIPVPLQNLLLRCLTEDPEERLPQAGDFVSQLRQARELLHGVSRKPYVPRGSEKPRFTWPNLAQAGPKLKNVWEAARPRAQKAKDAALVHWGSLRQAPRRLWWGLGIAALVLLLITVGVRVSRQPAAPPQPVKVAAPAALPPVGGGPPLKETGEAGAPREAAPVARPAPTASLATPVTKEERYMLTVAAYTTMKSAEALQQRLRAKNHKALIVKRKTGTKTRYVVQVGPITGSKAAADAAARIKAQEKITPVIVKLASRPGVANHRRQSR